METDSDVTISSVAFNNGFSDATYFNRCFKKEYAMTPSEYISKVIRFKEYICKNLRHEKTFDDDDY